MQTALRRAKQCEKRKFEYEWCSNYREMLFEETVLGALFVIQFIILEGYFLNFRQFSTAMIELNLSVFFCRFFFFMITLEGNLFHFSMDSSSITFDLMY